VKAKCGNNEYRILGFIDENSVLLMYFTNPDSSAPITLSGNPGDDAKPYQEKAVKEALREAKK
jgi:hypothetical protein